MSVVETEVGRRRVLVISAAGMQVGSDIVESLGPGFVVDAAPPHALRAVRPDSYDAVVIDAGDAPAAAGRLCAQLHPRARPPIVVAGSPPGRDEATRTVEWLTRPIDPRALRAAIRGALAGGSSSNSIPRERQRRPSGREAAGAAAAWAARALMRNRSAAVTSRDVAALEQVMRVERYAGGTRVHRAGDMPGAVRIVHHGSLELLATACGRATIRLLRPGDVLGDVETLLQRPETTEVRAITDATLLAIARDDWLHLMQARPHLARLWMLSVADRVAYLEQRLSDLLAHDLDAQVASLLLRECEDGEMELSQAGIARLLGVQRSSVNRTLRKLADRGVLDVGYRRLRIADRDALARFASGSE